MGSLSNIVKLASPLAAMTGVPGALVSFGASTLLDTQKNRQQKAQQNLAYAQLRDKQNLDQAQQEQNAALEREKLATETALEDERRRQALRSAASRQRTLFAAQGISLNDTGSSEAVLDGLYADANVEDSYRTQLARMKDAAIDRSLSERTQRNLLESTQTAQRNRLSQILQAQ